MFDHSMEGARFGLIDTSNAPFTKKLSYKLYKYIDTQYSGVVTNLEYLNGCKYHPEDGSTYSIYTGHIKSYLSSLDPFNTGWVSKQGGFKWDKAMPVTIDTVPELEARKILNGVTFDSEKNDFKTDAIRFDSKSFVYDGTKKVLTLNKALSDGVTVEYHELIDNNKVIVAEPFLTDIGSKFYLATFKKDGVEIGSQQATITIGNVALNKGAYNWDEEMEVTANIDALPEGYTIVMEMVGKPVIWYKYTYDKTTQNGIITFKWRNHNTTDYPKNVFDPGVYAISLMDASGNKTTLFNVTVVMPVFSI